MGISLKEMSADEISNLPSLGLDDTFEFNCKECGKCCRQRQDILLTPYDLYRIAGFLGRTTVEILERYCEAYEGGNSHLPVIRVVPVPPNNSCPFLRNKKCIIHMRKPVVCRVYPLARVSAEGKTNFIFSGAGCNHEPKTLTVREWIADVASEESEEAGLLWGDAVAELYPLVQPDALKLSAKLRTLLMNTMIATLWVNYDVKQPFAPQFKLNYEELKTSIEKAKEQLEQSE